MRGELRGELRRQLHHEGVAAPICRELRAVAHARRPTMEGERQHGAPPPSQLPPGCLHIQTLAAAATALTAAATTLTATTLTAAAATTLPTAAAVGPRGESALHGEEGLRGDGLRLEAAHLRLETLRVEA